MTLPQFWCVQQALNRLHFITDIKIIFFTAVIIDRIKIFITSCSSESNFSSFLSSQFASCKTFIMNFIQKSLTWWIIQNFFNIHFRSVCRHQTEAILIFFLLKNFSSKLINLIIVNQNIIYLLFFIPLVIKMSINFMPHFAFHNTLYMTWCDVNHSNLES
jgi:hypothetical protein